MIKSDCNFVVLAMSYGDYLFQKYYILCQYIIMESNYIQYCTFTNVNVFEGAVVVTGEGGGGGNFHYKGIYRRGLEGVYFSGVQVYEWVSFSHQKHYEWGIFFTQKVYEWVKYKK